MFSGKTAILSLAAGMALAGCATGKLDAQWSDPQFAGQPLAGSKVLVVCQATEQTVVRICQDQFAAQLRVFGVTPVLADNLAASGGTTTDQQAAARSLGARAILLASLNPVVGVSSSGSAVGFGFGSGGHRSGVGLGMSFPIGGSTQNTVVTYVSDTTLSNVANGKLMWSGKASTMSQEVPDQLESLAKVTVESARKAGML